MTYRIHPDEEAEALERAFGELASKRAHMGTAARECTASVSAWSAEQHMYHVALSADLALRNVAALLRGAGGRIVHEGGPNALAVRVLEQGGYPRGESEAPRMVRPPDEVEGEYLTTEMEQNRSALAALASELPRIPDAAGRIPHLYLGELNAAEWLRFARLHTEHHLAIVSDIERGG